MCHLIQILSFYHSRMILFDRTLSQFALGHKARKVQEKLYLNDACTDLDYCYELQPESCLNCDAPAFEIERKLGQTSLGLSYFHIKSQQHLLSFSLRFLNLPKRKNLIAAGICNQYSVCPSSRPNCTRCCLTMHNMIQVCSNFHSAQLFITNARADEIVPGYVAGVVAKAPNLPRLTNPIRMNLPKWTNRILTDLPIFTNRIRIDPPRRTNRIQSGYLDT